MRTIFISIVVLIGFYLSSCQSTSYDSDVFGISFLDVQRSLISNSPSIDLFFNGGPIKFETIKNFEIPLNHDLQIKADLFLPHQNYAAPLLIFQHGNHSSKKYHQHQALLAASWGFNAMTLEQPNQGQWLENGKNLNKLVNLLVRWPELLKRKFNPKEIILVGHSFGGSAIAIASGLGAPVLGLIFLDPAFVHKSVGAHLKKITAPSILIGADKKVFKSRKRKLFYNLVNGPKIEFSIKGATHNDAQFPNMFSWKQTLGLAPSPHEDKQRQFAAAIVGSAFALTNKLSILKLSQSIEQSRHLAIKKFRKQLN